MEILSSRIVIRPREPERALDFYGRVLNLPIYREYGHRVAGGVVYFLGGGFLEVAGQTQENASDATQLWLQVRDIGAVHARLMQHQVPILESPTRKPWGLLEMRARDPDGRTLIFVEIPADHPLRKDVRGASDGSDTDSHRDGRLAR